MAIVKCHNRRQGTTYVYESTGFFDEQLGKYRYKRHLIGKIDPGSGEMVPTGKKGDYHSRLNAPPREDPSVVGRLKPGRKKKPEPTPATSDESLLAELEESRAENQRLEKELASLQVKLVSEQKAHQALVSEYNRFITKLRDMIPPLAGS